MQAAAGEPVGPCRRALGRARGFGIVSASPRIFLPARRSLVLASTLLLPMSFAPCSGWAQEAPAASASAAAHETGTVKATSADGLTLTNTAGQDIAISVPANAKVLMVPPGSRDLKSATPGSLSDVVHGDRVLVTGAAGSASGPLTAARVIVMKSSAIAETHAAEEAAWLRGGGGIVKSVDPATGVIAVVNGSRSLMVKTTPSTSFRRYAGSSVQFQDAVASSMGAVQPGDQLRVRGEKSTDGSEIMADAVVTGSFKHYSGLISAIDTASGSVTLKDLASKHVVTVQITPESNLRRLPPQVAQMIAGEGKGSAGGQEGHRGGETAGAPARPRPDLAQILPRLPAQALGDLKVGEAVMIVATSDSQASNHSTAITLVAGVEPILAAPGGDSQTLSPWNVGGGEPEAGGAGGAQP